MRRLFFDRDDSLAPAPRRKKIARRGVNVSRSTLKGLMDLFSDDLAGPQSAAQETRVRWPNVLLALAALAALVAALVLPSAHDRPRLQPQPQPVMVGPTAQASVPQQPAQRPRRQRRIHRRSRRDTNRPTPAPRRRSQTPLSPTAPPPAAPATRPAPIPSVDREFGP